jgi:integrase
LWWWVNSILVCSNGCEDYDDGTRRIFLKRLHGITGHGRYAFPSYRTPTGDRAMSSNAILAALRRLGYSKEEMTAHGFRAIASTALYENGWSGDAIERQLAHMEKNAIKAAYNHTEHLKERREMMQWLADYLDELKTSGKKAA